MNKAVFEEDTTSVIKFDTWSTDTTEVYIRQRIPKGQSKKDNPEKLATYGTQDEEKQR